MKDTKVQQDLLDNREQKKAEMVGQTLKKKIQQGKFQSISDIFYRLPLPRIQKNNYKFLFDNIRQNVQVVLQKQDKVRQLQKIQQESIDLIQLKLSRVAAFPPDQQLFKQKLYSGNALHKSLIFLRNQQAKQLGFNKHIGQMQPFLPDSHFIQLQKIKKQIPNLKLFLQDQQPIRRHQFIFQSQNQIIFKDKSFPSSYQINKRAEVLAKLYLLDLYRQQSRKLLIMDRNDQAQLQKKRQINKIKQEMEIEKMKQGEFIEDMDLLKQVYKILEWIEKKMNALAYEEFKNKNGERATQIKKSLEKLKNYVGSQTVVVNKLKILIAYKHRKGF